MKSLPFYISLVWEKIPSGLPPTLRITCPPKPQRNCCSQQRRLTLLLSAFSVNYTERIGIYFTPLSGLVNPLALFYIVQYSLWGKWFGTFFLPFVFPGVFSQSFFFCGSACLSFAKSFFLTVSWDVNYFSRFWEKKTVGFLRIPGQIYSIMNHIRIGILGESCYSFISLIFGYQLSSFVWEVMSQCKGSSTAGVGLKWANGLGLTSF